MQWVSGKEKAHKHKQILPVTARVGGGALPTGWPGVSRPVARGQKFMCCVRNPRNINIFVRVPGREDSGTRPGGSVTGVTEKLFMCQMFMCLFRPLGLAKRVYTSARDKILHPLACNDCKTRPTQTLRTYTSNMLRTITDAWECGFGVCFETTSRITSCLGL